MGETVVHSGECIQLSLHIDLILGVQVHFKSLSAVNLVANSLSNNLSGVHNVLQDLLVDVGEGPGTRAGSLLGSRAVEGLGKNGSLGNEHNVASTDIA